MAPNKRGGALSEEKQKELRDGAAAGCHGDGGGGSVVTKEEVESRGTGTNDIGDTYDYSRRIYCERRVFFTGLMFLTRLPCPGWCDHHPAFLMRATQWFPLIGTLIGLWGSAFYRAAFILWPKSPINAACLSTFATVWLTGCIHEDGLSDCFDGFGGGWGRKQIMRIMKDSRVGTYALVGVVMVMVMKLRCLEGMGPERAVVAMVVAHTVARWTSLPLLYWCKYVQDDEDAKGNYYNVFAKSQRVLTPMRILIGTVVTAAVPYYLLGLEKACLVYATVVIISVLSAYYGNLVLGGVVGDYLGATIQVTELCVYLALTADWDHARQNWETLVILAGVASLPLIYTRRIIDTTSSSSNGGC